MSLRDKVIRYTLGAVLLIVALNAFAGGWYGMAGARDVPLKWLEGSPFHSYLIPGFILFTVVGVSALVAAMLVFVRHKYARPCALVAGGIMIVWILAQVSVIGYVSWLQPAVFSAGVLSIILSRYLPSGSIK